MARVQLKMKVTMYHHPKLITASSKEWQQGISNEMRSFLVFFSTTWIEMFQIYCWYDLPLLHCSLFGWGNVCALNRCCIACLIGCDTHSGGQVFTQYLLPFLTLKTKVLWFLQKASQISIHIFWRQITKPKYQTMKTSCSSSLPIPPIQPNPLAFYSSNPHSQYLFRLCLLYCENPW